MIAVDLCSGAGGVTTGFAEAGLRVVAALDFDADARATFALNHPKPILLDDNLLDISPRSFLRRIKLRKGAIDVLTACVPCQPYSSLASMNKQKDDPRYKLVSRIGDFVRTLTPRALVMENVPGLVHDIRFKRLVGRLRRLNYGVWFGVVRASDFGVPQTRRRLVLIALRGRRDEDMPNLTPDHRALKGRHLKPPTVRIVLDSVARGAEAIDPLMKRRTKFGTRTVATRIANIPKDGGGRKSLPAHLRLQCHRNLKRTRKSDARNVYGRMAWDGLAPTLTTRCVTPACGRFLHPEENRPITLREAAALQTFPLHYRFSGGPGAIEMQIGNAVPPKLACAVALVVRHELTISNPSPGRDSVRE